MAGRLTGRVAIVTGGARGIGAACAWRLAADGAAVVITDILDDEGRHLVHEIRETGARVGFMRVDVTSETQWAAAIDGTVKDFGGLNILVNNAGIGTLEDVEVETLAGYHKVIEVDQIGVFLGMHAAAKPMKRARQGSIINISSIYGSVGGTGGSIAYHAAKGAVRLMTKSAALHWAKDGIRVNSVHPGFIDTPMIAPFTTGNDPVAEQFRHFITSATPMGRVGRAEEIANVVAFLASDEASYMTGSEVYVDGGYTAA